MGSSYSLFSFSNVRKNTRKKEEKRDLTKNMCSILSASVPPDQSVPIFTGVFVIVWIGAAVVTMNAKLLGGSV